MLLYTNESLVDKLRQLDPPNQPLLFRFFKVDPGLNKVAVLNESWAMYEVEVDEFQPELGKVQFSPICSGQSTHF